MLSIVILTKNEGRDLPRCLASMAWCDDVHVLDSGSTDDTVAIAARSGANVATNPFVSFGQQRNAALDRLTLKHPWILFLDADEVCTDAFRAAALNAVKTTPAETAGFYCCWKMMLEDRWLKRCDGFPKWQFRLLRAGRARFTDFGHGQKESEVRGNIEYLREPYLHFGFSKGWSQWMDRHNRYSSQEAVSRLQGRPPWRHLLAKHSSVRNPALKIWLGRVPGWPLLRFFQAYVIKLGFLEGIPGLIYCVNISYFEFLVVIKMRELRHKMAEEIQASEK